MSLHHTGLVLFKCATDYRRLLGLVSTLGRCLLLTIGMPASMLAQGHWSHNIGIVGGPVLYDYTSSGAGMAFKMSLSSNIGSEFMLEAMSGFMSTEEVVFAGSAIVPSFVSDLQLQYQPLIKSVQPYVGIGLGYLVDLRSEERRFHPDMSRFTFCYQTSLGVRIPIFSQLYLQTDLRLRGLGFDWIGEFKSESIEAMAGVGWRIHRD